MRSCLHMLMKTTIQCISYLSQNKITLYQEVSNEIVESIKILKKKTLIYILKIIFLEKDKYKL